MNVAYNSPEPHPGINTAFLLKYNTSNGSLAWQKPLQGNVSYAVRSADNGVWCMDNAKNIHAVLGFAAGTHLDGLITVPSTFTNTFQYYLVKFNYNNGNMTPAPNPVLLPVTGTLASAVGGGKINMLYDEALNRYYIAGSRSASFLSPFPFSYNSVPFNNEGFMLAINAGNGNEIWRKEFSAPNTTAQDDKIFGLVKDNDSNIYLSGYYYRGTTATSVATFGNYSFPIPFNSGINPFVLKMNSSGEVQWAKIHEGLTATAPMGYRFMRGQLVLNGNELAFVKGAIGDKWGAFQMTRAQNDSADPLLVRLNKDTGEVIGTNEIQSNYGFQDELTAVAVDNDGNYVVGGLFHSQLFTDASDGVNTLVATGNNGKSQFFISKLAKSVCSQLSVEENASEVGIKVYPNPVKDILYVKSQNPIERYEIFSSVGQLVSSNTWKISTSSVDVSSLPKGVYYIKLFTAKHNVVEKFVKD
ncbi:T9SS type A sorting domain-containing protein [Chryseobacterium arachidis]|uniref:T9SS type A sorting domain-containing protein n=1 Tax=Chryseobacterium arachidis TaxID=1416778 RepID=UPI00360B7956